MKVEALVNITVPGTELSLKENYLIENVQHLLDANYIQHWVVDTIPGWGCLNQDWLQFITEIDTSFEWVSFTEIINDTKGFSVQEFNNCFPSGRLLMMVSYRTIDEKGNNKYIPHN